MVLSRSWRLFALQVLGRHWVFEGRQGEKVEVPRFAEGLIGQRPLLKPGQWFAYGSGCTLPGGAPGTMKGAILVAAIPESTSLGEAKAESGAPETWEVEVAPLSLRAE